MKGHAIIGPGFFRQNTSGYALGVSTPKASPSGWVFSQAQHPMNKTYNIIAVAVQKGRRTGIIIGNCW